MATDEATAEVPARQQGRGCPIHEMTPARARGLTAPFEDMDPESPPSRPPAAHAGALLPGKRLRLRHCHRHRTTKPADAHPRRHDLVPGSLRATRSSREPGRVPGPRLQPAPGCSSGSPHRSAQRAARGGQGIARGAGQGRRSRDASAMRRPDARLCRRECAARQRAPYRVRRRTARRVAAPRTSGTAADAEAFVDAAAGAGRAP